MPGSLNRMTSLLLLSGSLFLSAGVLHAQTVTFDDPNLENAVREALGIGGTEPITLELVQSLTTLVSSGRGINNLTGIELLTQLDFLDLKSNSIDDITPLAGLTQLTHLFLGQNSIGNITPLAGLAQLTELGLGQNSIGDITPLAGLTQLSFLDLDSNSINDISPLAGLTQLGFLDLAFTSISDLSPLAGLTQLTDLNLDAISITDVSPLTGLTQLISLHLASTSINDIIFLAGLSQLGFLDLNSNSINDISPLAGLTQLTDLFLGQNPIGDITPLGGLTQLTNLGLNRAAIEDITPLVGMTQLTTLFLDANAISDITPLSGLTQLKELVLDRNPISDISALSGLTQLTRFRLNRSTVRDLTPLAGLTQLTELRLGVNSIDDISPLAGLTQLDFLLLGRNSISDITPLAGLTQLTSLYLYRNSINDITPLAGMTQMKDLGLGRNSISDITPLAGLTQLTRLWLRANSISDITPLAALTQLNLLNLKVNSISDITPLAALTQLTDLLLFSNSISDITPLAALTQLTRLNLSSNSISDITSLATLFQLTTLRIHSNFISDITLLSGFTELTDLLLGGNSISDITPLTGLTRLARLRLNSNSISDLTPLLANPGLGAGDLIDLRTNSLLPDDCDNVQTLIDRGAEVLDNSSCNPNIEIRWAGGTMEVDGSVQFADSDNWVIGEVPGPDDAAVIPQDSGEIVLDDSVAVRSIGLNAASTLQVMSSGTLTLNNGASNVASGATLKIEGTLEVGGLPEAANNSTALLSQHEGSQGGTIITSSGTITWNGGSINLEGGASLVNENTGTLNIRATLDGSPALLVRDGGTFTNSGAVTWSGGAIEMRGSARLENLAGAVFSGSGTITGDVQNAGAFNVGGSIGSITVTGDYEQTGSGSLNVELAGTDASNFDVLTVGSSTLDGTLNVSLADGFGPSGGDRFPILLGPTTGSFETTNLPELTEGFLWEVLYGSVTLAISDKTVLIANFLNGNDELLNSRVYLWNPSTNAGNVTVRVFTLPTRGGLAQELSTTPLDLGTLGARSALNLKVAEDILAPLEITTPYITDGGNLTLEFTIEAAGVRGAAQVFSPSFAFGTYPLQEIPPSSSGSPTVLVANFTNGNNALLNSRVYLWNPSESAGNVTVRVFTLPVVGGLARELTTTPLVLGTLGARSALNLKLAEDVLTPLEMPLPYTEDGGNLVLEFTIAAADVRGAAQVFSSDFAFGTYPLQEIPSSSSESPTVLVANFMNGNNAAFNSRVYLWNPSESSGNVTVRVFTLPVVGSLAQELTTTPLVLGTLGARSALNLKLAEDILTNLGITTPYTTDGGNLTLEFTIEAAGVRGAAQVFSSSFAFGTNPLQEIPSTSSGDPTVLVANFMNGNDGVFNSRVYLWNPSQSAGKVTVRVFTLPTSGGTAQELSTTPLDLGTLGARSALNIKVAEDILAKAEISRPYTTDGGNLTLEFTIEAENVRGAAQVFAPSFAFGTYPLQEIR